ncbi:DUF899 family protein [Sanguibacter sp. Z1732]|uniref:DUF899 family protein n=1 Tax=Sanguibacter sp. Z1732 TaxID=3435412 RepID=UPI003D9C9646
MRHTGPQVVDRATWEDARGVLLQQEKALTRMKDAISAARRRMPIVRVRSDYAFEGPEGRVTLLELFQGRDQLIVQHFMFAPDWTQGCDGCSMMAERVGPLSHLHARRTSFVLTSRAPLPRLLTFRDRMGWDLPWYSTIGDAFTPSSAPRSTARSTRRSASSCVGARRCSTPGPPTRVERNRS